MSAPMKPRDRADARDEEPWSEMDVVELRSAISFGQTIEEAAHFLGRSREDVAAKANQLGLSTTRH